MFGFILRFIYHFFKHKPDVSQEWLQDHKRRSYGVGIDQSRSTWPWKGWEK